jgi:hypothetical protein
MSQGVTDFATVNIADFKGFGFGRVWNPMDSSVPRWGED